MDQQLAAADVAQFGHLRQREAVVPLLRVNPSFGLMYFLAYILIMFIIFINVFLAILGEAYSMVREKMEEEEEERKKAEKGRRKRTFGEWLKMLRAVWKARKAKQAKEKAAGG